ncbi:MAG TPA: phosphonate degradation HD-domain oxygenase [Usitatibacter sp.]|jgi:phosphonate degradation associated HDIG domain protein|nr:phosphonate degradation HD-domain oxygenase [Usitatibacter sp.]
MALRFRELEKLFADHGHIAYDGEGVTQLEHALQSAQLAEEEHAGDALVAAALLHDIGHLLNLHGETPSARGVDDQHQYFAIPFIRPLFPSSVVEPIRLHVDAKRALCALEPGYLDALSADSKRSLSLQGGVFSREACEAFIAKPFARDAMRVRRWDDHAKSPGAKTPGLGHYLAIASRMVSP